MIQAILEYLLKQPDCKSAKVVTIAGEPYVKAKMHITLPDGTQYKTTRHYDAGGNQCDV